MSDEQYNSKRGSFSTWRHMMARCYDQTHPQYADYGGRGIKVCDRWHVHEHFWQDVYPKPSIKYTLDRVKNDKGYELGNCTWSTRSEQNNNKRSNVVWNVRGIRKTIAQWSDQIGVSPRLLWHRVNTLGWSKAKAVQTPTGRVGQRPKTLYRHKRKTLSLWDWSKELDTPLATLKWRAKNGTLGPGWSEVKVK